MSAPNSTDRTALVALFRELAPGSLPVVSPSLSPPLADLLDKPLPRRPKAILFDIYGTLLVSAAGGLHDAPHRMGKGPADEMDDRRRSIAANLLAAEKIEEEAPFATIADLMREVPEAIRESRKAIEIEVGGTPEIVVEEVLAIRFPGLGMARARRLVALYEAVANPCAPMPHAERALRTLKNRGIVMGLVSNAQFYTPLVFEALLGFAPRDFGIRDELSFYSYQMGVAKPDPSVFGVAAGALGTLGIDATETVVIGNSAANDVAPARAAGFMTILFAGDARSFRPAAGDFPSAEAQPDAVIRDFDTLEVLMATR